MNRAGMAVGVALVMALFVALWQGPGLVSQAGLRAWVGPQLQRALDQGVAIDGDIRFALLPSPLLVAQRLRISRDGQEVGRIAEARLHLQILPLLSGQIRPASLTLLRPELRWTPEPAAPSPSPAEQAAPSASAITVPAIRTSAPWPSEIRIEQGQAIIAGTTLAPLDLTLRHQGEALHLDGKAGWQNRVIMVNATLAAGSSDLALRLPEGGELQWHGQGGLGTLQGKLSGKVADLSLLLPDLPALAAQFSSDLSWKEDGLDASAVKLTLGESDLTGQAHLALGGRSRFDLTLHGGLIDLDRAAATKPTVSRTPTPAVNAPAVGSSPSTPPSTPRWSGPDGQLSLSIDQLRWRGRIMQEVRLDLQADHGELTLDHASLSLPGNSQVAVFGRWTAIDGFVGSFEARSDDLRQMLGWAGQETDVIAADRLHVARLAGDIKGSPADLTLERVRLKIDSSQIDLSARYRAGPRPALGLTFALDSLNADAYLPRKSASPITSAAAPPAADIAAPAAPPPMAIDAEISGKIGRLLWRGVGMQDIAISAGWNGERLTLKPLTIGDVFGARLQWTGDIVRAAQGLSFDGMKGEIKAADLSRLLQGFGADLPLALPAAFSVTLQGAVDHPSLHVSASQLDFGKTRLLQPAADVTLAPDQIVLEKLTGRLFGGQLSGEGSLSRQNSAGKIHLALSQGQMREALLDVADLGLADGVLEGEVTLTSQGHYSSELKAHLDGSGRLLIKDGEIKGFDLKAADRAITGQQGLGGLIMLLQAGLNGGVTHFSQLSGTAQIEHGIITSNDMKLQAEGGGAVAFARVDLPADLVDAHADFRFASASDAPPLVMRLTGNLQSPRRFFDIKPLQQWLIEHTVKGGKPKDVLKGLLHGIIK